MIVPFGEKNIPAIFVENSRNQTDFKKEEKEKKSKKYQKEKVGNNSKKKGIHQYSKSSIWRKSVKSPTFGDSGTP